MEIEHKIESGLNLEALTPEAVLTFNKYSIDGINGDYRINQRAIQCMAVVIKSIELGLMKNKDIEKKAKIINKIMAKVAKIIDDIESHLESDSEFDSNLYCIDLSEMFDVSDKELYFSIIRALEELLNIRHLASANDSKKLYIYGWHKAEYFGNKFTQKKINCVCEDVAVMVKIENHIKNEIAKNNGKCDIEITDEMPASKIEACANLLNMRYSKYETIVEMHKYR